MPHMGNLYIAVEALFNEMGHEVIVPPKCSKKTLNYGTKYSPETMCLPLKINVGNFIEAIELGAEAIVMIGGSGPCRLGLYGALEQEILVDLDKQVDFIILEHPRENYSLLKKQVKQLIAKKGVKSLIYGMLLAWEKLKAIERLERIANIIRPRELEHGITSRNLNNGLTRLRLANSIASIRNVGREGYELIANIPTNDTITPLRIGIVGEIFTIIEPFTNLDLEERLGYLGVEVNRTVDLVEWVKDHVILNAFHLYSLEPLKQKAAGYLNDFVGGHGLESVARTIMLAEENYDGIIHILPFTCMPEIIAQSILPRVSSDFGIPVLSLVVDEHTGEAGFQTRLEAFVDLIDRRLEEESQYAQA